MWAWASSGWAWEGRQAAGKAGCVPKCWAGRATQVHRSCVVLKGNVWCTWNVVRKEGRTERCGLAGLHQLRLRGLGGRDPEGCTDTLQFRAKPAGHVIAPIRFNGLLFIGGTAAGLLADTPGDTGGVRSMDKRQGTSKRTVQNQRALQATTTHRAKTHKEIVVLYCFWTMSSAGPRSCVDIAEFMTPPRLWSWL